MSVDIERVGPERAADVLKVVHEAFAGRPVLDPPATALDETEESIGAALADGGGLLATHWSKPVGSLLLHRQSPRGWMRLSRVGVLPEVRHLGAAQDLVRAAEAEAEAAGCVGVELSARVELPKTVRFWQRQGYAIVDSAGPMLTLRKRLPVRRQAPTRDDMHALGREIAGWLRAGDLVILTGGLGAGKTTLTQGIGVGLGVRGDVTSPTFVIARVHRGPLPLVHVDAYRLGGVAELDDLDLDTDLEDCVTVVEWGEGLAEALAQDRLEIAIVADPATEAREVTVTPIGARWAR